MIRGLLACLVLAAAALLSSGHSTAQESGLRPSIAIEEGDYGVVDAPDLEETEPAMPPPTSLAVNPLPEAPIRLKRIRADDDPYAPTGIDLGGFVAFPAMRIGGAYTDNVAQSHSGREDDIGLRIRPSLRAESEWVRHSFRLSANGDFSFYKDQPDYNEMSAYAAAQLRLDVRRSAELAVEGNYYLAQDSAGESDVPDDAVGNRTEQTYQATIALLNRAARFETQLKTGIVWRTYSDVELAGGGEENNSDRDYYEPEVALRAGYEVSAAVKPFVEAAYRPRFHDQTPDRNGLDRDSNGYSASAGIVFEPSPIWSADLALNYLVRDYDDPSLDTIDAVGLQGSVEWRPTAITKVKLRAGTSIDETAIDGSSGSRNYETDLDVFHELHDNVVLTAGAGIEYDDFEGVDLKELTLRSRLGIVWRLSRFAALTGDYDFTWFDSNDSQSDYREHRITAGVELRR